MTEGCGGCRWLPAAADSDPPPAEIVALEVRLLEASRAFEVSDKGNLIVSGERAPGAAASPGEVGGPPAPGSQLGSAHPEAFLPCPLSAGKVYQWEDPDPKLFDSQGGLAPEAPTGPEATSRLAPGDVYKELRLCGYDYGPQFQGIHEASFEGGVPTRCPGRVRGGPS